MKKKFNIVEIENLSGMKASICSILVEGSDKTEFEELMEFNANIYHEVVNEVIKRLDKIANYSGVDSFFFNWKTNPDIYALSDTDNLRIFCIIKENKIIILGGGGSKFGATYQDNPNLQEPFDEIKKISKIIDSTFTGSLDIETLEMLTLEIEV